MSDLDGQSASAHSSTEGSLPRPSTPASVQKLHTFMRKVLRVTLTDGRIILGTFAGTDKQLNILLVNSDEYRIGADYIDGDPNGRFVGQLMIPWRSVTKVEVSTRADGGGVLPKADAEDDVRYA